MPPQCRLTRFRVALIAAVAASLTAAAPASAAPPSACFTYSPATVKPGTVVTFDSACSSDPDGDLAARAWDLDGDATADFADDGTGPTASRSFPAAGTYVIRLRVTDSKGAVSTATQNITVNDNRPPEASFSVSPTSPLSGQTITFTSTSTDPDGTIRKLQWDTDGNSTATWGDAQPATVTKAFANPGTYPIRLRVTDNDYSINIRTVQVTVRNRAPVANFTFTPAQPVAGDPVALSSSATDPDGSVSAHAWDLDNDGAYDDATGADARWTPPAAGAFSVGLRVTDNSNATHVVTKTINVGARPGQAPPPPPAPPEGGAEPPPEPQVFDISSPTGESEIPQVPFPVPVAPFRMLDPFPTVRMRGRTTKRGVQLSLLTVRAPHGSVAEVRCTGRGCPGKVQRRKVKTKSKRGSTSVRFTRYQRFLPAGIQLRVYVRARGKVGKYTRIKIRRVALPVRVDRCLRPDSTKPTACPSPP